jgi:hypothetical protein
MLTADTKFPEESFSTSVIVTLLMLSRARKAVTAGSLVWLLG